jgi:hypothetical protein
MLGKLLKYELKSTSRMMGVLYLAVLVVAAVVGFIARGMILGATQGNAIAVVISGLIYGLLIVALMIVTIVMVLQRFYKNLLKGEGYLMHTLPVPTWMLVASKVISSLIWILLSIAVLFVSIFVLVLTGMLGNGLFSKPIFFICCKNVCIVSRAVSRFISCILPSSSVTNLPLVL